MPHGPAPVPPATSPTAPPGRGRGSGGPLGRHAPATRAAPAGLSRATGTGRRAAYRTRAPPTGPAAPPLARGTANPPGGPASRRQLSGRGRHWPSKLRKDSTGRLQLQGKVTSGAFVQNVAQPHEAFFFFIQPGCMGIPKTRRVGSIPPTPSLFLGPDIKIFIQRRRNFSLCSAFVGGGLPSFALFIFAWLEKILPAQNF